MICRYWTRPALLAAVSSLCSALAYGQIQDLATTDDGEQTYFATVFRQKGSTQGSYLRIFRIAENGLELFREGVPGTKYYIAQRPSLSADGREVGFTAGAECLGGGGQCVGVFPFAGAIAGNPDKVTLPISRNLEVSRDGEVYIAIELVNGLLTPVIGDVRSGAETTFKDGSWIGDLRQTILDSQTALVGRSGDIYLWKGGQFTRLPLPANVRNARLNATAEMVVYETESSTELTLRSYSVSSGRDVLLTSEPYSAAYTPLFSRVTNDGKYVSYVLNNRLLVQSTDGGPTQALTAVEDGRIVEGTISGNGRVAFATTDFGRLLRIDVATGEKRELIPSQPKIGFGALVPGGRIDMLIDGSMEGNPAFAGMDPPAVVVGRSAGAITFQLPWETPVGFLIKPYWPSEPTPLEDATDRPVRSGIPAFYALSGDKGIYPPYALAAHQDFSGLVTEAKAARPGEVVHFYLTGLGEVRPAIATGTVTSSDHLYVLQTPFACQVLQYTLPVINVVAQIFFAGLAPGTIGIEQVDLRIPEGLRPGLATIYCESRGAFLSAGSAQIPIAGPSSNSVP
jgi:uncharacterized protein (TIGR03437 family)